MPARAREAVRTGQPCGMVGAQLPLASNREAAGVGRRNTTIIAEIRVNGPWHAG